MAHSAKASASRTCKHAAWEEHIAPSPIKRVQPEAGSTKEGAMDFARVGQSEGTRISMLLSMCVPLGISLYVQSRHGASPIP